MGMTGGCSGPGRRRSVESPSSGRRSVIGITLYGCKMLHDSATIRANHERFVARVAELEVVWGLQAPSGFAVCPSNEDEARQVLMFWSDRGYASRVKQNHFP